MELIFFSEVYFFPKLLLLFLQNSMEDAVQDNCDAPSNVNKGTTTVKAGAGTSR